MFIILKNKLSTTSFAWCNTTSLTDCSSSSAEQHYQRCTCPYLRSVFVLLSLLKSFESWTSLRNIVAQTYLSHKYLTIFSSYCIGHTITRMYYEGLYISYNTATDIVSKVRVTPLSFAVRHGYWLADCQDAIGNALFIADL